MPTIVFISPKGGVGKTTSALVLGSQLARRGYPTTIIDADPNKPLRRWAQEGHADGLRIVWEVAEDTIIDVITAESAESSVVIVDLEGTAGLIALHAVSQADFVIIPMQASELDAAEAAKALRVIKDYKRMSNRLVPHAVLFTRRTGAIMTKTFKKQCADLRTAGIPILNNELKEREAFKLMFSFSRTLEQMDAKDAPSRDAAIVNAEEFLAEVAGLIERNQPGAVYG